MKFLIENQLLNEENFKSLIKIFERNLDPTETVYHELKSS